MEPTLMTMVQAAAKQVTSIPGFVSSLGWLVAPKKMKSAAKNRAIGQAEALIAGEQAIEQAVMSGKIICPPGMDPQQVMQAMNTMACEAVEKQVRRERIAIKAYEMLPADKREQAVELREEFKIRFFHAAEEVSSEEVQERWAKLLAGEISRPGFFSLRTLDVLRNMSSEEARLLQHYGKYTFDGIVFLPSEEEESSVFKEDWTQLYEADLAYEESTYGEIALNPGQVAVSHFKDMNFFIRNNASSSIGMQGHVLTKAGRELTCLGPFPQMDTIIRKYTDPQSRDLEWGKCGSDMVETCTRRLGLHSFWR